ncbi:vesicle-associated membrane protein 4-like [Tubulanus polymorphus]|uniref:vesicle-associated membrane protein 4-like n=1 Tax=Tubulanus polymorphus TaxID=672921 RepID=UPI003DA55E14
MPPKFKRHVAGQDFTSARESEKVSLLDGDSDEEDFFLNGQNAKPGPNDKIKRLQGQVDEVVDVMQDNIGKVLDRGDRLEDLQDKSENLTSNADLFRVRAKGLKTTMWWRECKMRILVAAIIIIVLLIIFVPIIIQKTKKT